MFYSEENKTYCRNLIDTSIYHFKSTFHSLFYTLHDNFYQLTGLTGV